MSFEEASTLLSHRDIHSWIASFLSVRSNLRSCKEHAKTNAYFNMVRSNLEYI